MAVEILLDNHENIKKFPNNAEFAADIYDPFQERIIKYVYRLLGNWQSAQELTQDTFLKAYEHFANAQSRGKLNTGPWLYTIARNLAVDQLRRVRVIRCESMDPFNPPSIADSSPHNQPEQSTLLREEQSEIQSALAKLPPNYQLALKYRYWLGMSCQEIGQNLEISSSAAKTTLFRARHAFKAQFKQKLEP